MNFIFIIAVILMLINGCASNTVDPSKHGVSLIKQGGAEQSFNSVQDAIDAAEPNSHIILQDGEYFISEPLEIDAEKSGLTIEAAKNAKPVITGGVTIGNFTEDSNGLWRANIADIRKNFYFEQLFVNSGRAVRAKFPDKGMIKIKGIKEHIIEKGNGRFPLKARQTIALYKKDFKILENLNDKEIRDVQFIAYHKWNDTRRFIDKIDREKRTVDIVGSGMKPWNRMNKSTRFYLENLESALTVPGEWFLTRAGILYYRPLPGETIENTRFTAPLSDGFVKIKGKKGQFAENITFKGIEFRYSAYKTPKNGFGPQQAAADLKASITVDFADNAVFDNCSFSHIGTYAFWFRKGCVNSKIINCHIYDCGGGGVKIGETEISANTAEYTYGNRVENSKIDHIGVLFPCAVGVLILQSGNNTITHNDIGYLNYSAVSVGWTWGYGKSLAKSNKITYNHLHDIYGELSDLAGIYTLGRSEGTVISNNLIHDVRCHSYGGWGLYTDEGSSNILMENNLVYNTQTGAFHQHFGRENIIRNNIFAFGEHYQVQATRVEKHLSFIFENNIIIYKQGTVLQGHWTKMNIKMDKNCYWQIDGKPVEIQGMSFSKWQKTGKDRHSIVANPQFADALKFDFKLKKSSPVFKLGFKEFDCNEAGLYKN